MEEKTKGRYYKVLKLSIAATLISLMSSMVYFSSARGVVIEFDEDGHATIKEGAEAVIPEKGQLAPIDSDEEYFSRRSEWIKNNREVVNDFQHKKSRESAIYFSWIPWLIVAWLMRSMSLQYNIIAFAAPVIVAFIGWISVNEFLVIALTYLTGTLIVRLSPKGG